jgi:hypothetical protein
MQNDEYENLEENEEILDDLPPEVREDKIFNNRYNTGDGLTDVDDYEFSKKISVVSEYSHNYLKDIYEYEENLEEKFILDSIFSFLQTDPDTSKIIQTENSTFSAKVKLTKEDINFIFNKVNNNLDLTSSAMMFYSPIYIIEVISSISSIEYKKIFDSLETELQEMLIIELNKKYKFLDGKLHKKRMH